MEIYLVGGAVRDGLLGRPVTERDWVVVGSTPAEMTRLGYKQVGRDFPVFLHPQTAEEHALARTERKTGPGHAGFVCHAGPEVNLEDDLARRDLTVNAMARDAHGGLVDPFHGRTDLERRVLRHVSEAFVEDPLRVFRVARFAAQLPGFEVAPETLALMSRMARDGELAELSAERVWQELHKALGSAAPERFFQVLAEAGAMTPWLPELAGETLRFPHEGRTQPQGPPSAEERFAALAWDLTPAAVRSLCRRLKSPRRFEQMAGHVARYGRTLAGWNGQDPETLLDALSAIGALGEQRDPAPVLAVVEACGAVDLAGLRRLIDGLRMVVSVPFRARGLTGKALGDAIREARLERIRTMRSAS